MKKILFLSLITFFFAANAQVGVIQSAGETSKWTFGGSAGLGGSFGSGGGGTSLHVSPRVGYKLTENLEAGLAGGFTWENSEFYSSTTIGVGPFANYYVGRNFYLSGMFQQYFFNPKDKYNDLNYSTDESTLYLGGGYMQRIGGRAYLQIGVMYNVLYDEDTSVFGSGFVPSVGVVFGL